MGFISSLFGGRPDSSQEIADIARRAAERAQKNTRRGGFLGLFRRNDAQLDKELAAKVRSDERQRYYEHERQLHEAERVHQSITRPRYEYELKQSYRVPYYEAEVARLKQENSPYAAHAEEQLHYAQQSVERYMHTYDHEHEREKYNQKWEFKQQQKEYANQVFEQAHQQKEQYAEQMKRRQDMQQALHTQSNIGRGGKSNQPLGRGSRFKSFGPPQARGSYGRGGRSSL